ncbi:MAG: PilZ domain-containing protein [Acidobacteriota bacterium]|nr:PilZ domain-containing protein [Acidobacteriota bacterium]
MSKEHKRIRERIELKLPVRVHCRETLDFEWVEITCLMDVTPFGAGFTLKHPIEKGRLLRMTIPMPRQLRVFDHVEDQYKVWGLVRYARTLPTETDKAPVFEVGVAFVGKRPPKSYKEDPAKRYEIAGSAMETVLTEDIEQVLAAWPLADHREYTRHNIPVDILLETLDEKGLVAQSENTVTENISPRGAMIFTSLAIAKGRFVRLNSKQYNLTVFAAVRSSGKGADGIGRIHVEFIGREWPL